MNEISETPGGQVGQPQFAAPDVTLISPEILETFLVRQLLTFPELRGDVVNPDALAGLYLDAVSNGPLINAAGLAEAIGTRDPVPEMLEFFLRRADINETVRKALEQMLGIQIRDRSLSEASADHIMTLDDTLTAGTSESVLVVSIARIRQDAAEQVVRLGQSLFGESGQRNQLRRDLSDAIAAYIASAGSFDANGFRNFVMSSGRHANAVQIMDKLSELWVAIKTMGLNDDEVEEIREYIYSEIVPETLTTTQLHDAIMASGTPGVAYTGS